MVELASPLITANVRVNGWRVATDNSVNRYMPVDLTGATGWTLSCWLDVSGQSYGSYALGAVLGLADDTAVASDLDKGALGMVGNGAHKGRLYSQPSHDRNASLCPSHVLGQGPVHLAIRIDQVSGDDRTVTPFINGVPMYATAETVTLPIASAILGGEMDIAGALEAPNRYANVRFEATAQSDAQIAARYLEERTSLNVHAPEMLVVGSFDGLTASPIGPFWAAIGDAKLRPGAHAMQDALAGSKHGDGSDLAGTGSNYNSPGRQGLRRRVLDSGSKHYSKVLWLCMFGTNDLVAGVMDPNTADWMSGRDIIDTMIAADIALSSNPAIISPVLMTIPPNGAWHADWIANGSPTTVASATTIASKREIARQLYNQDCRVNRAARGYDDLIDYDAYVPNGFGTMQAAANDAFANGENSLFLSDGFRWSQAGGAEISANVLVPYLEAQLRSGGTGSIGPAALITTSTLITQGGIA